MLCLTQLRLPLGLGICQVSLVAKCEWATVVAAGPAPQVDLAEVDVMLVTHFHLDHCAAVPYVTGHTPFRGRVLMTHPTKAIVHTLLRDFVKVSRGGTGAVEELVRLAASQSSEPAHSCCTMAVMDPELCRCSSCSSSGSSHRPAVPPGEGLYSEKDLEAAIERTEVIDFHQAGGGHLGWYCSRRPAGRGLPWWPAMHCRLRPARAGWA